MISVLPSELLYNIAGRLEDYDIYSLIQCNRRLLQILRHTLYEENMLYNDGWALIWAILNNKSQTMLNALETGATSLGEALAIAAETGQEDTVKLLLAQDNANFHPNYFTYPYAMDMSWTCQDRVSSRSAAVASLRQHKPLRCFLAYDALSPLSRALLGSHMGIAKILIESGKIDIDHPEYEGRTSLSIIAEYGGLASLRLLLDLGNPNVYSKAHSGRTPFSYSTENDDIAVFQALLDTGFTDVDQEDEAGYTPFVYAIESGNIDAMEALIHMEVNQNQGDCLLRSISQIWGRFHSLDSSQIESPQYIRFWKILMECEDFDINEQTSDQYTTLHAVAGGYGGGEVLRLFINSEKMCPAGLNSRDLEGRNALSYAASDGHYTAVQALLESGKVDRDHKDDYGRTPFSYAAGSGAKSARLFIEFEEIDLDSRDNQGRTPLSYAAGSGIKETVQLLVETSRVDLNFQDIRGRTPFSHAAASGSKECVQFLMGLMVLTYILQMINSAHLSHMQ